MHKGQDQVNIVEVNKYFIVQILVNIQRCLLLAPPTTVNIYIYTRKLNKKANVVLTKSDSDVIFCLQLLSKI